MSNESALILAIIDQLNDHIANIKHDIEPNRVTIPPSWRKDGKYKRKYTSGCNQPFMSRPLPEKIAEGVAEAHKAPRCFCIEHGSHIDPEGYEWWDRSFWGAAVIMGRLQRYINEMER